MSTYLFILLVSLVFFIVSLGFDDVHLDALDVDTHGGGGWLTLRSLLLFGIGFGALGVLSMFYGLSPIAAAGIGIGGGAGSVAMGVKLSQMLIGQESDSTPNNSRLINRDAVVCTRIAENGVGEVTLHNEYGTLVHMAARSGWPREVGARVVVRAITGNTVWVE